MASAAGRVADSTRQERLSDSHGPYENDVFLAVDKAEGEQIADAIAVERDRRLPVEAFEGLLLLEAGTAQPHLQILLIAAIDLVLEDEFQEVEFGEFGLAGVGDAVGQRRQDAREPQPLPPGGGVSAATARIR